MKSGPNSEHVNTYTYDATTGRFGTVSDGTNTFTYGYIPNSSLLATVTGPAHLVTNTYESTRDALTTKVNSRVSDSSIISSIDYTVNALGQRTNATRSGTATNSTAWDYDALGQVKSADDSNNAADRVFEYDQIGNRKKSATSLTLPATDNYTANTLNQYTAAPTISSPTYDDDGNLLSDGSKTHTWDSENRLTSVAGATYKYDAFSRRIAKTLAGVTVITIYDGWNPVIQFSSLDTSFSIRTSYTWGQDVNGYLQGAGGVGGLLTVRETGANAGDYFPAYDGNGNISEYVNAAGTIVAHYEYDPFGGQISANGPKEAIFERRFSTKPLDTESGYFYYGYRNYDPQRGRWLSRDPMGERGGLNLYNFCLNRSIEQVDVLGLIGSNSGTQCPEGYSESTDRTFDSLEPKPKRNQQIFWSTPIIGTDSNGNRAVGAFWTYKDDSAAWEHTGQGLPSQCGEGLSGSLGITTGKARGETHGVTYTLGVQLQLPIWIIKDGRISFVGQKQWNSSITTTENESNTVTIRVEAPKKDGYCLYAVAVVYVETIETGTRRIAPGSSVIESKPSVIEIIRRAPSYYICEKKCK